MKIKLNDSNPIVYEIDVNQSLKSVDWEDFLFSQNDSTRLFFIQALSHNSEQLQGWLSAIDANPLILERCIDPDAISGTFTYEQMFVLQLPVIDDWKSSEYLKTTLICLQNTFIIASKKSLFPQDGFLANELLPSIYRQTNVTGMLYMLLDGLIDHSSDLVLQIRRSVDNLEQNMCQRSFIIKAQRVSIVHRTTASVS